MAFPPPAHCPSCGSELSITRLNCPGCEMELSGAFSPCRYCTLTDRQKVFLDAFLRCRGSIKDVERELGISYPTVKGLLDDLLAALFGDQSSSAGPDRAGILDMLERGEISAAEAAELLRKG